MVASYLARCHIRELSSEQVLYEMLDRLHTHNDALSCIYQQQWSAGHLMKLHTRLSQVARTVL